jgi:hypothetical protein
MPPLAASELLGAGPEALRRWFGDPDLRRAEGDAEVLLFLGSGCALDLVLYAEGGAKRVAHAAARADGPAAVTEADCLRGIAASWGCWWEGLAVAPGPAQLARWEAFPLAIRNGLHSSGPSGRFCWRRSLV